MSITTQVRIALGIEPMSCKTCRWAEIEDGRGCLRYGIGRGNYAMAVIECQPVSTGEFKLWALRD